MRSKRCVTTPRKLNITSSHSCALAFRLADAVARLQPRAQKRVTLMASSRPFLTQINRALLWLRFFVEFFACERIYVRDGFPSIEIRKFALTLTVVPASQSFLRNSITNCGFSFYSHPHTSQIQKHNASINQPSRGHFSYRNCRDHSH